MLKQNYLHADETTVQVLQEEGRKNTTVSYMWVYATGKSSDKPVRMFEYRPGRSGDYPKESISNNLDENYIRPFTVGRKNWLFCGSPKGAASSATVYSLIETAKANGLSPYKYLLCILGNLPAEDFHRQPEYLEKYLPWNEDIRQLCK